MNATEHDNPDITPIKERVKTLVHESYWERDDNCATTSLYALGLLFEIPISDEVWYATIGLWGAGGYGAQCGLVEGPLMFLGIYGSYFGYTRDTIVGWCRRFAEKFDEEFGSLNCSDLRPEGFTPENEQSHICEELSVKAIMFAWKFIWSDTRSVPR